MIYNLGSLNIGPFYRFSRLLEPGATLAARDFATGLGEKSANQSAAAIFVTRKGTPDVIPSRDEVTVLG